MQVKKSSLSDTSTIISVSADRSELEPIKKTTVQRLSDNVKLAGFRNGKAPLALVEKNLDQSLLQTEFLEDAISQLYLAAIDEYHLRPLDRPKITLKKFVPFDTLEFDAEIESIGQITLADYKKIKLPLSKIVITDKDVEDVITSLQKRLAEKNDVDRAAKDNDQVWIDFQGIDSKGQDVKGAKGKDYPLILGSNTFIPGFEPNLIGLKAGDEKSFTIPFPKDYGVKALAGKKITFTVTVTKVQEIIEPKIDDGFAAKAGPFKSLAELKNDIKKQLASERQNEADRNYENQLVKTITAKSKVSAPQILIDEQIERLLRDLQQNITYRGQTYQEYLDAQGTTDEEFKANILKPQAEERVKAGLVLSEIAEQEKIAVTPEEIDLSIQAVKSQYQDAAMQAELDKPEGRRNITSRLLTEKTLQKLVSYASKKS